MLPRSAAPILRRPLALLGALLFLSAAPRAFAQANGGLGLDLSGDASKKDAQPAQPAPAAEPQPLDNPPLEPLPGEKKADKPAIDVGERDVSLEDRVKSVQKKGFNKKHHFELTPKVGLSLNDPFFQKYSFGGEATFHFSDSFALGARFDYLVVQTTENVPTAKRELQSRLPVSKPKYGGAADFFWTPIYGKASLFNSIIHFDLFALAGAGVVVSQTSSSASQPDNPMLNQGPHPAIDLGIGQRYALNELMAIQWQLIETLYTDTPGGTGSSQLQRIMTLSAGVSFFLPPVHSEQ